MTTCFCSSYTVLLKLHRTWTCRTSSEACRDSHINTSPRRATSDNPRRAVRVRTGSDCGEHLRSSADCTDDSDPQGGMHISLICSALAYMVVEVEPLSALCRGQTRTSYSCTWAQSPGSTFERLRSTLSKRCCSLYGE